MASKKYVEHFFKMIYLHSVHPLLRGVESYQIFKKWGLTGSKYLDGGLLEKRG